MIRKLKREDHLPKLVVVALGSNGSVTKGNIHDALDLVGKKRTLGLVTPRELGGGAVTTPTSSARGAQAQEPDPCCSTGSSTAPGTPSWFQPDGLHLTFDGAEAMARLFSGLLHLLPNPH